MSLYGLVKQHRREKQTAMGISLTGNATISIDGKKLSLASRHKYDNPDARCGYHDTPMDYCWSYAHHKDGTVGYETMSKICPQCEYWKGVKS